MSADHSNSDIGGNTKRVKSGRRPSKAEARIKVLPDPATTYSGFEKYCRSAL